MTTKYETLARKWLGEDDGEAAAKVIWFARWLDAERCYCHHPKEPVKKCCSKCYQRVDNHTPDGDVYQSQEQCTNRLCPCHKPGAVESNKSTGCECPKCHRTSEVIDMRDCPFCKPRPVIEPLPNRTPASEIIPGEEIIDIKAKLNQVIAALNK